MSSSCRCWRGSGHRPSGPAAPLGRSLALCLSPPVLQEERGVRGAGGEGLLGHCCAQVAEGWAVESQSHSLRDTWMSSVTLNTPEVTKLSWKSVESVWERGGHA